MTSRSRRAAAVFFLAGGGFLASDARSQGFTIGPWSFVEPAPVSSGLVVRCERAGEVTNAAGTLLHLRAASHTALQPPDPSQCEITLEATAQIAVTSATRLQVRTRLRGQMHTDLYTQAFAIGAVQVGTACYSSSRYVAEPGTQAVAVADSVEVCLGPGNVAIWVLFRASSTVLWGPAYDTEAWCDFLTGDAGFLVELVDAGGCTVMPPPMVEPHFGIFADAAGTRCNIPAPLYQLSTMYVLARGGSVCGLAGADFRIDGFPPEWQAWIYPSSEASVALGNPVAGGCDLAFGTCQSSTMAPTLLYRIDFLPTTVVANRELAIRHHSRPSCPAFCCVNWVLCDPPIFTKRCVPTTSGFLNGSTDPCTTHIETTSWSTVKDLYRP